MNGIQEIIYNIINKKSNNQFYSDNVKYISDLYKSDYDFYI